MKTIIACAVFWAVWCTPLLRAAENPLPSWREGKTRQNILEFVRKVTREGADTYVRPEERVAVFDNDGTLWTEQPTYTQFIFGMDRARELSSRHPEWKDKEPFKSAIAGDLDGVVASGVKGLIELTAGVHGGLTTGEFEEVVNRWLASARHPRFNRPYTDCVYQPMLELIRFLEAHGFKTYIISGGSLEVMRPWTERVYGIPPERVVGSTVRTRLEERQGKPVIVRSEEVELLNDKTEKVLSIERVISRRPIFACGNSDGDLPMLQWTAAGAGPRFCVYVHHTDEVREYAYDRKAATGKLDKGLDEARDKGWTVVDMKQDWSRVFPFDLK